MIVISLQIFNTKNYSLLAPEPFQICKFRKIYPRCPYNASVLNKQRMYSRFQSSRYRRLDWNRQVCLPSLVSRAKKKKTEMRLKENDDDMSLFPTWISYFLLASREILEKLTGGTL